MGLKGRAHPAQFSLQVIGHCVCSRPGQWCQGDDLRGRLQHDSGERVVRNDRPMPGIGLGWWAGQRAQRLKPQAELMLLARAGTQNGPGV